MNTPKNNVIETSKESRKTAFFPAAVKKVKKLFDKLAFLTTTATVVTTTACGTDIIANSGTTFADAQHMGKGWIQQGANKVAEMDKGISNNESIKDKVQKAFSDKKREYENQLYTVEMATGFTTAVLYLKRTQVGYTEYKKVRLIYDTNNMFTPLSAKESSWDGYTKE